VEKMLTSYEKQGKGKGVAVLVFGPFLGLAYFISLPFIAIGTIVVLIGRSVLRGMLSLMRNLVSFGWRPSEAYLAGRKKAKKRD
jgi:hypothetical protein